MTSGLLSRYRAMVDAGAIQADPAQALAVEKLQILSNRLASYTPPAKTDFFSFFTRKRGAVPRGLYLYGGVGRGKTMLMDLFFAAAPFAKKRRAHFHEFMADVHERIAAARARETAEPLAAVAEALAAEAGLLCFDELFVTNIADAMILGRLFAALFDHGVVMVATSNAHPRELYRDGLNRPLFEPFIDLIEDKMEVMQLEAARDYRQEKLAGAPLYFTPLGDAAQAGLDEVWRKLIGGAEARPETLTVKGRKVAVPKAAMGAARFAFADLFEQPLGPEDYLAIARAYHTVFVDGAPVLTPERRNAARRFITFIDALYDNRTGLVMSANAEPDALYPSGDGADHFQRTASRLTEMRSAEYLARRRAV
ncbi:MAG: cell division protein ZapE [Hyphomicrobiales bacterium]|nr:cell division protein ZapE [Hyphomicrobiales bacterium]